MPKCCICYTTDPAYLFPTFVSAVQARRHSSLSKADVVIFSFGADEATERDFAAACRVEGIGFESVSRSQIGGAPVMLARLFLTRFVAAQYSQFVYIDGDTQISGSLDPLIEADVPDGHFMAANDPMTFAVPGGGSHGRGISEHFAAIGIPPQQGCRYFNTGVLRINRMGWDEIGMAAWEMFQANHQAFRFPDQDVLNIAGGAKCIPMSLAWNFPIFMRNSRVETEIKPRIYHFMSNPKPWHGAFPPWGTNALTPYQEVVAKFPYLSRYRTHMSVPRQVKYHLQQRYKKVLETFTWGMSEKRHRILTYETRLALTASGPKMVMPRGLH